MAQRVNIEVLNKAAVDVTVQNSNAINVEVPTAPRDFVPRFTADKTEVEQLNSVDFSASEAGFEYYWEIQDTGGFIFKSGKNVSHQYDNIGEFDVALTQADLSKQKSGIQVKRNFIKVVEPDALLDKPFAIGATAAYSLRRLKSSATKAVRVREDSGNTETDIGFSGGTLDETALSNHCGSANGFVSRWYDQSGNGNDASNSTASAQPQIVSSGSVIKENNDPAIEYDNLDDQLIKDPFTTNLPFTIFSVSSSNNDGNDHRILDGGSGVITLWYGARNEIRLFNGSTIDYSKNNYSNIKLLTATARSNGNGEIYENGTQKVSGSVGTGNFNVLSLGSGAAGNKNLNGYLQEVIIFDDIKAEQSEIENNIMNHYSI